MPGALHKDLWKCISCPILLGTRNVPIKIYRENTILCSVTFCRKSFHLWNNGEKRGTARQARDGNTIRRMHFACVCVYIYIYIIDFDCGVCVCIHTHTHHNRSLLLCCWATLKVTWGAKVKIILWHAQSGRGGIARKPALEGGGRSTLRPGSFPSKQSRYQM
jgi:hypothetical protein